VNWQSHHSNSNFLSCTGHSAWVCEKCDFDLCPSCFIFSSSSEEDNKKKNNENEMKLDQKRVLRLQEEEHEKREDAEEEAEEIKKMGGPFAPNIIRPPPQNRDRNKK
jgi:hypothetical protein